MADRHANNDRDVSEQQSQNNENEAGGMPENGQIEQSDSIEEAYAEEYCVLDKQLDEIDSWMDKLEEQNDTLFQELDNLLETNKQTRKELQELSTQQPSSESDAQMETDDQEKAS